MPPLAKIKKTLTGFAIITELFSKQVIPALLLALDDYETPRVQTHAGAALVNFSEQCPKSLLVKYLPVIVEKMQKVLQVRLEEVREGGGREGGREVREGRR